MANKEEYAVRPDLNTGHGHPLQLHQALHHDSDLTPHPEPFDFLLLRERQRRLTGGTMLLVSLLGAGLRLRSRGTGRRSTGGTGRRSSGGTGRRSSGGTGRRSSGGTGRRSSGGTGRRSSNGTGRPSSGGRSRLYCCALRLRLLLCS